MNNYHPLALPVLAALLCAPRAFAQVPNATADAVTLDAVVVTSANRTAEALDDIAASVDVIDRARIEQLQARDLSDLLRSATGIDIARNGGSGSTSSLFVRGTNSNHVLVLIDGVRVATATTGTYSFEQLPIELIERIELIRGPRAALWGSDAIGGVLQIFTRRDAKPAASVTVGNLDSAQVAARIGMGDEAGRFSIAAQSRRTGGFSAQNPLGFGFNPDDDDYQQAAVSLNGDWQAADWRFGGELAGNDAKVDFDQGQSDQRQRHAAVHASGQTGQWAHQFTLANARDTLITAAFDSRFSTRRTQLDTLHEGALSDAVLLNLGINVLSERGNSTSVDGRDSSFAQRRNRLGGFARLHIDGSAWDSSATLRVEDDENFGSHLTLHGDTVVTLSAVSSAYVSAGQGFRAPNFNELFSPGFGGLFAGNPDLNPEQSTSLEAGLRADYGSGWRAEMALYRTRIKDLISFSGGQTFRAENIARADIEGAELRVDYARDQTQAGFRLTASDPRNGVTGAPLLRRAKHQVALDLQHQFGDFSVGGDVKWVSARADIGGALAPYSLVGLRAQWQFQSRLRLQLKVDNVGDRDYTLVRGFNTTPRQFSLSLRYDG